MIIRAIDDFAHYGQRKTGDVWEELDHYANQLIKKGLAEEFSPEMEEAEKAEAEAAAKEAAKAVTETASKTKAKVKTNDKPADADGSQTTP